MSNYTEESKKIYNEVCYKYKHHWLSTTITQTMAMEMITKSLDISRVSGSSIPKLPERPLSRVMREGVGHFCTNCGSTMPKSGFLMLFGKRYCDNDKCPNSKPLNNYF